MNSLVKQVSDYHVCLSLEQRKIFKVLKNARKIKARRFSTVNTAQGDGSEIGHLPLTVLSANELAMKEAGM